MKNALFFNVLVKEEKFGYLAHCLELDLVTTAPTMEQAGEDMADVIACQVDYAFTNDNLDYLYHPASTEVWAEFFGCQEILTEIKRPLKASSGSVHPWIIAKTCKSSEQCHA